MKHFTPEKIEKLYVCKGRFPVRVIERPLAGASINEGDVFILQKDQDIYFWVGKEANIQERSKGREVAYHIRADEMCGRSDIKFPREDPELDTKFWGILGGKPATISAAVQDQVNETAEFRIKLYQVRQESQLEVKEITQRPLQKSQLDSSDVMLLELSNKIYVWTGRNSNLDERQQGIRIGLSFLEQQGKAKTQITRIAEGIEDTQFKSYFNGFYLPLVVDYGEFVASIDTSVKRNQRIKSVVDQERSQQSLLTSLDSYKIDVYLINGQEFEKIADNEFGHFFDKEIYAVDLQSEGSRLIYTWFGPQVELGKKSQFRDTVLKLTNNEITETMRFKQIQSGHEDLAFLQIFKGITVHNGKRVDLQAKMGQKDSMYKVMDYDNQFARAFEQPDIASENLNEFYSFVITHE